MQELMSGLSREECLVCWAVIIAFGYIAVCSILKNKKLLGKIILGFICVFVFYFGSQIINLNSLSRSVLDKLNIVKEQVGDTYIRVDGGDVLINIRDNWVNLNEIAIVGEFTKDVKINYEGEEIYLGHSGVYNTIKVLNDLGLIGGK